MFYEVIYQLCVFTYFLSVSKRALWLKSELEHFRKYCSHSAIRSTFPSIPKNGHSMGENALGYTIQSLLLGICSITLVPPRDDLSVLCREFSPHVSLPRTWNCSNGFLPDRNDVFHPNSGSTNVATKGHNP